MSDFSSEKPHGGTVLTLGGTLVSSPGSDDVGPASITGTRPMGDPFGSHGCFGAPVDMRVCRAWGGGYARRSTETDSSPWSAGLGEQGGTPTVRQTGGPPLHLIRKYDF